MAVAHGSWYHKKVSLKLELVALSIFLVQVYLNISSERIQILENRILSEKITLCPGVNQQKDTIHWTGRTQRMACLYGSSQCQASAAFSGVRISLIKGGCTAKSNCLDYCHWKLCLTRHNRICPVEEVQERERRQWISALEKHLVVRGDLCSYMRPYWIETIQSHSYNGYSGEGVFH